MILLVCIATFLATLSGGLFALKFRDKLHLILGFSAGAVLGVVFFELLPEAVQTGKGEYNIRELLSAAMLGFLIYMIFDRLALLHTHEDNGRVNLKTQMSAAALSAHSLLDGMAIGLSFQMSYSIGITIAVAIVAHDFSDGINTVNLLIRERGNNKKAVQWLLIDAIAPVIGVISTYFFRLPEAWFGKLLALFAGFFLYIGASDLLPQSHQRYPKFLTTVMTILGTVLIYLVTRISR